MADFEWVEDRPTPDEYFMSMAHLVSTRSTCLRRKVGAVLVKEKRILTTGYNGSPRGLKHCSEVGCTRMEHDVPSGQRHELCRGVHAEQNAVIQGALFGISVKGATLYCTNFPCSLCAKMMLNAGITEIVYCEDYIDDLAKELLQESGANVRQFVMTHQE